MIAVQTAPQIRLIQGSDHDLVEKIQSSILTTVPLWKNQIVIAISLYRQQKALELQQQVSETTNELLAKNAELLREGQAKVGREVERGVVDVETLRKVNSDLIATLEETIRIQDEGRQKRLQAEGEIVQLQGELRHKLIELRGQVPQISPPDEPLLPRGNGSREHAARRRRRRGVWPRHHAQRGQRQVARAVDSAPRRAARSGRPPSRQRFLARTEHRYAGRVGHDHLGAHPTGAVRQGQRLGRAEEGVARAADLARESGNFCAMALAASLPLSATRRRARAGRDRGDGADQSLDRRRGVAEGDVDDHIARVGGLDGQGVVGAQPAFELVARKAERGEESVSRTGSKATAPGCRASSAPSTATPGTAPRRSRASAARLRASPQRASPPSTICRRAASIDT